MPGSKPMARRLKPERGCIVKLGWRGSTALEEYEKGCSARSVRTPASLSHANWPGANA